jgi:glucuronate isomerase
MKRFMGKGFCLSTRAAERLYHDYAEGMPIYDFHCHLPPRDIAENRGFSSIAEAWLGGDHYKWRAMRAAGVPERLVTGDAPDREKFAAWAAVVPQTIGNPLHHWTHLELRRYFGVTDLLCPDTADAVYDRCTEALGREEFRVRPLLARMKVRVVCTTDDPVDSLECHARLAAEAAFPVTVAPTFRPDAALGVDEPAGFNAWVARLEQASGASVRSWTDLLAALRSRHDLFHARGCRASDHGIEEPYAEECSSRDADLAFKSARGGRAPEPAEVLRYRSALMRELARMDAEKGWVMQLHLGALRNVNSRFHARLGPNTGFDAIGGFPLVRGLARFLDGLDAEGRLPKTVLYSLDPTDNAALAALTGCFPQEGVRGKMQLGSAWWFNDQKHGMQEQLRALADMGLLSRFVGMLTDSRSFLSFPRHEYFRRILCDMLGAGVASGEIPADWPLLGGMVRGICWGNAAEYFAVPLKDGRADGGA